MTAKGRCVESEARHSSNDLAMCRRGEKKETETEKRKKRRRREKKEKKEK